MLFLEKVRSFVSQHQLFAKGDVVVCGVSGGADSVCLLLLLKELGCRPVAAHCNFHLRAEESDADEAFVRDLCQQLEVPLHVKHFDTELFAQEQKVSIEMAARDLRYDWFRQLCQELGAKCVAVAHHRDDNVETLLLNLVRGTGLKGLCGMQPKNGVVVRPLLCVSRQEVLDYLKDKQQSYRIDSTNLKADFSRNKLRLEVLPLLREINAGADENISTAIENLNEVQMIYRYCVDEFVSASIDGASEVNIEMVLRAPSPLSVLHEILSPFGFNRPQLKELLAVIQRVGKSSGPTVNGVGKTFLSNTHRVVVNREQLIIETLEQPVIKPEIRQTVMEHTPDFRFNPDASFAYFDKAKLQGQLELRLVQEGDRFQPFGMKGTKLVSDFFTDLKLSRIEKARQWVLTCDGVIVWVVGRRTSDLFRVDPDTKEILVLQLL